MRRCRGLVTTLALALAASPAAAQDAGTGPGYERPAPKQGYSYPDCFCTDSNGQRVELGETVCLSIGSRRVLARCEMSANNPAWRYETESCPGV